MKAKSIKVKVTSKAKTAAAKAKPVVKNAAKKAAVKLVAKKPVAAKKPGVKKPVAKSPTKKLATKPLAKKVAVAKKPAVKKPAVKKPVAKSAPKKVAAKPVAKKVTAKPQAKKTLPAKKPAVKPAAKKSAAKPTAKPIAKPTGKNQTVQPEKIKTVPSAAGPKSAAAAPQQAAGAPEKARRPSGRLAQLTVPSMAPAVASTAAKASYIQTMPTEISPKIPTPPKKDPKLANNWKTKSGEELTDAELLAMPDSEYMNDKQLAAFRIRLRQLKQDILNNAGETTEHLREDTVIVPDPADRATIEEEHALELRTRDRERKLLKKIEQSLALIDAGEYGYCDETGEPIGVGRLLARPTATLSLEAQQRRELKQKMFGD